MFFGRVDLPYRRLTILRSRTIDGPYAETKEFIDGFALIEVKSADEAIEVAQRFMSVAGDGQAEVLAVYEQPSSGGK